MSQRRRLPNSLRWRAVGWMEMGLSQADAARRLNVSRSVVQLLWDQYQSEDSVSRRLVQADHELQHLQKTVFLALSARRRTTTVPQLVADHFQASGRRIPLLRCEIVFTMQVNMQEDQLCAFPSADDSGRTAYAGQEITCFLDAATMGFCAVPLRKVEEKQFETLNKETQLILAFREAEDWFRPIDLAKECDIYISSKNGSRKEIPITYGYTQDPFKNRPRNFKPKVKENYPQYLERENKNCYICGDSSHYARDCEKRFKLKESNSHIHNRINVNTLKVESEKQK
ncbi:paired domain-containing protein [Trichonephila clavipes]|nr:paired domain-containing protein [Trichonephila clavipes]